MLVLLFDFTCLFFVYSNLFLVCLFACLFVFLSLCLFLLLLLLFLFFVLRLKANSQLTKCSIKDPQNVRGDVTQSLYSVIASLIECFHSRSQHDANLLEQKKPFA